MGKAYIGVGHGRDPDTGVYQPGAVNGAIEEHMEAHKVADHVARALARSGVARRVERDSGDAHDPNYKGTRRILDAGNFACAVEIHFDCSTCGRGGFAVHRPGRSDVNSLVNKISNAWERRNLQRRPHIVRSTELVTGARPPTTIWECDAVDLYPDKVLQKMGEAIAEGICSFMGVDFVPPGKRFRVRRPNGTWTGPKSLKDALTIVRRLARRMGKGKGTTIRRVQ